MITPRDMPSDRTRMVECFPCRRNNAWHVTSSAPEIWEEFEALACSKSRSAIHHYPHPFPFPITLTSLSSLSQVIVTCTPFLQALSLQSLPFLVLIYQLSVSLGFVSMAAAIKAINAKIRSNKVLDYFCSTRMLSQLSTDLH